MKHYLIILLLAFVLPSCKEAVFKEQYVSNFENFIEEFRKNHTTYTEEDWKKAEEQYTLLSETEFNKFKDDLTAEQKNKVNSLKGSYYGIYAKHKAGELGNEFKDLLQQAEGVLKEIEK